MNQLTRLWVWLRRAPHSRGFGIQSPTDYWFVRYVVNEHWPYYQYAELGDGDDWLRRKLGRLYLRLANWLQPRLVVTSDYRDYFRAGCRRAEIRPEGDPPALVRLTVEEGMPALERAYGMADARSLLVVEGIWRDQELWRQVVADERTGTTFDLYYCGVVMFDKKRDKHHYIINF